jgi:hypothetical protein
MVGSPAYLLGKQGGRDAMFLPELFNLRIFASIQPFKCKSIKVKSSIQEKINTEVKFPSRFST